MIVLCILLLYDLNNACPDVCVCVFYITRVCTRTRDKDSPLSPHLPAEPPVAAHEPIVSPVSKKPRPRLTQACGRGFSIDHPVIYFDLDSLIFAKFSKILMACSE